ncbi:hypothetical protein Barb6_02864 [Bacteroidales bacterium Barb6]|nr:hypothetical protein Barb6_02864 [Bacteroidales bacterium Barb6]
MHDDAGDAVGGEVVEDGDDDCTVGEGAEEGDSPCGRVAPDEGYLVALLDTGAVKKNMELGYFTGKVAVQEGGGGVVGKGREMPMRLDALLNEG